MMATEATLERSNEATVTSDAEIPVKNDVNAGSADQDAADLNGVIDPVSPDEIENKHITDIVDDLVNSAEVSISGGSDTEASRSEATKLRDEEKGHARTASTAKKPATFKSVSVNKTFLAAKSAAGAAPAKATDKASASAGLATGQGGSAPAAARPRLVAKTGSGLRDLPRSGANGARPAGVPDPSAVWNKNRPPEPKKFTDEELKKYGIHMASRLQSDDANGQNNWADIEDDDEDWAPDAITWTDGTKIAIPHIDEHSTSPAPASPAPAPASIAKENKAVPPKSRSPAPPGVPAPTKLSTLATGKSLVLKGAPEKPTLVAKPPAPPTPVKSPWAPIPKVDKASPVVMDIPPPQQGGRYVPGQMAGMQSRTPPPPKEIAADDFSRASWKGEGAAYGSRELFNSQSGRYEPVTDRRASRADPHVRGQPAVLQRSSQADSQGPAEPSAAFQTHRTSGQEPPYGRRRGSSNVSGGSGFIARYGKAADLPAQMAGPELLGARRESFAGGSDSAASHAISPSTQPGEDLARQQQPPWQQARMSPASHHSVPNHQASAQQPSSVEAKLAPPTQPMQQNSGAAPGTDDYEYQKKLMRERRELAMKRRLEEEAQLEAEKQERIRLKLAAMGPAPDRKSAKKESGNDIVAPESSASTTRSDSRSIPDSGSFSESKSQRHSETKEQEPSVSLPNGTGNQPAGRTILQSKQKAEDNTRSTENRPTQQAWGTGSGTWPSAPQSTSGNVWGPPSRDRTLGNGTFTAGLGRIPDPTTSQVSQAESAGPGPIAPPRYSRDSSKVSPNAEQDGILGRQPPIGPPHSQSSAGSMGAGRQATANAWANAVQTSDAAIAAEARAKREESVRKREAEGLTAAQTQAVITDKWRPVKLSEEGRRIEDSKRQVAVHGSRPAWNVQQTEAASSTQQQAANDGDMDRISAIQKNNAAQDAAMTSTLSGSRAPAAPATRSQTSRFFPSRDVRNEPGYNEAITTTRPGSPSPPPPDTMGHPAFDGDIAHPHVALPRPQPVVRLPPAGNNTATAVTTSSRANQPNFSWANPAPYRAGESSSSAAPASSSSASGQQPQTGSNWQARFDTLTGRSKGPVSPSNPAAVDSVTRGALEHGMHAAGVSLPGIAALKRASDDQRLPTTRVMAEDCFDQQEMGSLPPIRIPKVVPDNLWQPAPAPLPNRFAHKFRVTVLTVEAWEIGANDGGAFKVRLPSMAAAKVIQARTGSNPRARGGRGAGGPRTPSHNHRGGFKGRDSSAPFPEEQRPPLSASSSGPSPSSGRGGRGGFRARSENWSRQSTPLRT